MDTVNKLVKTFSKPKYSDKCIQTSKLIHNKERKDRTVEKRKKITKKLVIKKSSTESKEDISRNKSNEKVSKKDNLLFSKFYKYGCGDTGLKKEQDLVVLQNELIEFSKVLKATKIKSDNVQPENTKMKLPENRSRFENVKRLIKLERQLDYVWNKLNQISKDKSLERKRYIELKTKATQYSIPEIDEKQRTDYGKVNRNVTKTINMTGADLDLLRPNPIEKTNNNKEKSENRLLEMSKSKLLNEIQNLETILEKRDKSKQKFETVTEKIRNSCIPNFGLCKCNLNSSIAMKSIEDIKKDGYVRFCKRNSTQKTFLKLSQDPVDIGIQNNIVIKKNVSNKNISTKSSDLFKNSAIPRIKSVKHTNDMKNYLPPAIQNEIRNQMPIVGRKYWNKFKYNIVKTPDSNNRRSPLTKPSSESKNIRKIRDLCQIEQKMKMPKYKTYSFNKRNLQTPPLDKNRGHHRNYHYQSVIFKDFDEFQGKKIGGKSKE